MEPEKAKDIVISSVQELLDVYGTSNTLSVDASSYSYKSMIQTLNANTTVNVPNYVTYNGTNINYSPGYWGITNVGTNTVYRYSITKEVAEVDIEDDDGKTYTISRADLLKYISERELVEANLVVRQMYDRYQVAVKLVRSDDNGNTGL